jgi:hypothetical protein
MARDAPQEKALVMPVILYFSYSSLTRLSSSKPV